MQPSCAGHVHSTCDREVGAAAISWARNFPDLRVPLLERFGTSMLNGGKDTHFFVGNQHQRPATFMVLGVCYPRVGAALTVDETDVLIETARELTDDHLAVAAVVIALEAQQGHSA
jgi:hypothetical protein